MYRPTVEDMTFTKDFQQLSLADAAKGLKEKRTGWGVACKARHIAGVSRMLRIHPERAPKPPQSA